jgi:hypothetical protein
VRVGVAAVVRLAGRRKQHPEESQPKADLATPTPLHVSDLTGIDGSPGFCEQSQTRRPRVDSDTQKTLLVTPFHRLESALFGLA